MKREIKKKDIIGKYDIKLDIKNTEPYIWVCGCKITEPHSHFVVGHNCICEKGLVK